ncbi:MAG: universal stress protein [Syntrophobacterales bacterium]|nr:MAG: universal stress protein [Syntrophobacterales bacterium]
MSANVLIAFDDSENAMRAVDYVARFLAKDCRVTLFSVIPDTATLCDMNSPELTPYFKSQRDAFCVLENKKKEILTGAQLKARTLLVSNGFDEKQIQIKSDTKKKGIARDIAAEAQLGYDLIVVGRRGMSGIKEFFLGSTSQKILHLAQEVSNLIVN